MNNRILAMEALVILALAVSGSNAQDPRWIWGYNENNILPSDLIIPGRVEPTTHHVIPGRVQPTTHMHVVPGRVQPTTHHMIPGRVEPTRPQLMIPGRVEPTTSEHTESTTSHHGVEYHTLNIENSTSQGPPSTPSPQHDITTFHPSMPYLNTKKVSPWHPVQVANVPPPVSQDGGLTIKSRVVEDTLLNLDSVKSDRYTTLDKLFSERGHFDHSRVPLQARHLGGLDPQEVFYADDDLLIIKGGGFPVDTPEDRLQPLDQRLSADHENDFSGTEQITHLSRPSPHEEYNGNVPAIVLPPNKEHHYLQSLLSLHTGNIGSIPTVYTPISKFTEHHRNHVNNKRAVPTSHQISPYQSHSYIYPASHNIMHIPYVYPIQPVYQSQPVTSNQFHPQWSPKLAYSPYIGNKVPAAHIQAVSPHGQPPQHDGTFISLEGDTDVNFLHPRPPINPNAQIVSDEGEDFGNNYQYIQLHQTRNNENVRPDI